jgi:tRNA-Thr(GGU) m(6)t(6)A37 methyltransferase TsaA
VVDAAERDRRLAEIWASIDHRDEADSVAAMAELVAQLPADDPVGLFELASMYDSTGDPERAVAGYRRALDGGLSGQRRRRAVIQLASSLRNLGQAEQSVALLTAELNADSDDLDDAARAFLALALSSVGRDREAVSVALTALAPHLPRYNRSLAAYAGELVKVPAAEPGYVARPVGRVESPLTDRADAPRQGDEGAPECTVAFEPAVADALRDITPGTELILLTWLDRAHRDVLSVHPRDDATRPVTGVFSTRSADRPNPIGLHRVTVLGVDGTRLRVSGLEALDGTPVLDVKPVLGAVDQR